MSELYLTLLCSPEVEEQLLDLLLMSTNSPVFTSTPTAAHGLSHGRLSQTEQVLGRASASQIQVIVSTAHKLALLEEVRRRFPDSGVRYWVTPVVEAGEIK